MSGVKSSLKTGHEKCIIPGCRVSNTSLHCLPKDKDVADKWMDFIFGDLPKPVPSQAFRLCTAHFSQQFVLNQGLYDAGVVSKLLLMKGSIPTIRHPLPSIETVSKNYFITLTPFPKRSVGTQLSKDTLKTHIRTSQTSVVCENVWSPPLLTSTPLKPLPPKKRPRLELEEDDDEWEASIEATDPNDSTFIQTSLPYDVPKYIVYENCLLELFELCPVCSSMCDVRKTIRGTFLAVDQTCHRCEFNRQWKSQPFIGSTPAGNIHLSAAVYFTGTSFIQMKKVFNAFGVRSMRYQAFRKHAKTYLEPAIVWKWKRAQQVELQSLSQQSKVIIGGDMRADSPGHCAKFGSYTVMNLETSTVIDIQLVQSNEVGGSYYMEKEGLKRSLALLEASGVTLDCIVTDRHVQIQKYLREKGITQYYDVWHIDKGEGLNHLYWTASSSKTGPEKVAKWTSVIHHIHNIHTHEDPLFSKAFSKQLEKVLTNKRFIEGVEKLSPHHQTSSLEAFHSVVIRFAPKSVVYPFIGMLCRLYLSAFHFNENANRPQSTSALGGPAFKLAFPKAKKGGYSLKRRKIKPTFCK
uniref:THAP-type domain-containing protein n=1 Tax=Sander lucioperca TaxID=283035 RepID=A0A8D0D9L5_SANLU